MARLGLALALALALLIPVCVAAPEAECVGGLVWPVCERALRA